jgi:phage RecT family recombinase
MTAKPDTSVSVAVQRRDELLTFVGKYAEEIEKLAPRGMNADYFVASLRLYFAQNPKLLECKALSIAQGILRVAQTGLTLGVSCDLLPFKDVCQYSPRYTGIVELALASGTRAINLGVVREGDYFEFSKGTTMHLEHRPLGKSTAPILWGYAMAEIKQGSFALEIMTREAIDAHRKRWSKSWWWIDPKNQSKGVIPLEEVSWYAKKTPLRQLSNVLPKNPRLAAALIFEKAVEDEEIPEGEFEVEHEEEVRQPLASREEAFQDDRDLVEG